MKDLDPSLARVPQLRKAGVVVEYADGGVFATADEVLWNDGLRTILAAHADALAAELAEGYVAGLDTMVLDECGPVCPSQERFLSTEAIAPGFRDIQTPQLYLLDGPLDIACLERAFSKVIARQGALRTVFRRREPDGPAIQIVCEPFPLVLDVHDRSAAPDSDEALREVARAFPRWASLRRGPLLKAALVRLGHDRHALLLSLHHLVSDGWSVGILLDELSRIYRAGLDGSTPDLPPLPRSFAALSMELCARRRTPAVRASVDYWQDQLRRPWGTLRLPTAQPPDSPIATRVIERPVRVDAATVAALRACAAGWGVTLPATLIGCYAALLHEVSACDDLRIGTMGANRDLPDAEHLVGCFANAVVLRLRASPGAGHREWVQQAQEVLRGALRHQEAPFQDVVAALSEGPEGSSSELFSAWFVVNNVPGGHLDLPGVRCWPHDLWGEAPRRHLTTVDLRVELTPEPTGGFGGYMVFKHPDFTGEEIAALWRRYLEILDAVRRQWDSDAFSERRPR